MKYPDSLSDIKTGRSSKEDYIKTNYSEFYEYLIENYPNDLSLNEKLYWFYNGIKEHPVCVSCGKPTKFISNSRGYSLRCSCRCAQNDNSVREKYKSTLIGKYGENYNQQFAEKSKKTRLEKYGDENYNNIEKMKQTCLERYGVDNAQKAENIREKSKKTCLERYGKESFLGSEKYKEIKSKILEKTYKTNIKRYGYPSPMQSEDIKKKVKETCLEKYGVEWNCLREEAHNSRNSNSCRNTEFSSILDDKKIQYEKEFYLDGYLYDFKIGNFLIEINPSATHNVNWNPFSKSKIIDKNYHLNKTNIARKNGYDIIHVWDWDNIEIILDMISEKEKIYARDCKVKEIKPKEANLFLEENHLQGKVKNQKICLGLFFDNNLIEIMTFGKPRYNKNYEFELLRLCTKMKYSVIGGANKLFSYFVKRYNPKSIISYCDNSKFNGDIYYKLGMKLLGESVPSCLWVNVRNGKFVTDNELRKLGADKILGTDYGKGTSNEKIMIQHRWVQVYNCGQKTFIWNATDID